jgi:hypothetical protein
MVRTVKPSRKKVKKAPAPAAPQASEVAAPTIVERPGGYYWGSPDGDEEFGPDETDELAEAARDTFGDEAVAPGDALLEAEREISIADWIDVETGEPAEGQPSPHLRED